MNIRDKFFANQDFHYTTKLTDKQKLFVTCVTAGKNLIDSYKEAYETKSSNKVIGISANALLKRKLPQTVNKMKIETSISLEMRDEEVEIYGKPNCWDIRRG